MKMTKTSLALLLFTAVLLKAVVADVDTAATIQIKIRNRGTVILSVHSQAGLEAAKPAQGAAAAPAGGAAAPAGGAAAPAGGAAAPAGGAAAVPADKKGNRLKKENPAAPAGGAAAGGAAAGGAAAGGAGAGAAAAGGAAAGSAAAAGAAAGGAAAGAVASDKEKSIFQGDKTEVPVICNKLNKSQLLGLAANGPAYQKAWIEASGTKQGSYNDLPFLDDKKLAAFYKSIATGAKIEQGQLKPEEADAQSKDLLATIVFGDDKRTDIGWLEFWVYMCNDGNRPANNDYLSDIENIRKHVKGVLTGEIKPVEAKPAAPADGKAADGKAAAAGAPAKDQAAKPAAGTKTRFKKNSKKSLLKK